MSRARDNDWVLLFCEDCGQPFHLSARQGRAVRADKRSARCKLCRRISRKVTVQAEHYLFWMARFTDAELIELAEASWGDMQSWPDDWRGDIRFTTPPPR